MKKSLFTLLSAAAVIAMFASCGSTPKKETAQPEETAQTETAQEQEKTEEVPAEETDNLAGAEAARQNAIDAGADKICPDVFAALEIRFQELKAEKEAGKNVNKELADVEARYNALAQYSKALDSKKKIEDNNFQSYDQASYDAGCAALAACEAMLRDPSETGKNQLAKAEEANGKFTNVLFAAYKEKAKKARAEAFEAKKSADGVKAGVSAKEAYNKAVEEFRAGDSVYAMQNPESAFNHYTASAAMFTSLFTEVSAKREAAQKAMDEAKARVLESQTYAQEADVKAPLEGEEVQGIEAEDAVLLEQDNYESPESQEADIPAEISDDTAENASEQEAK